MPAGRKSPANRKSQPKRQASRRPSPPKATPRARAVAEPAGLPSEVEDYYGPEMLALIRAEQHPDAPESAVARLLSQGRKLGLDPLHGELYLARNPARDGAEQDWSVAVTRDALLKYAEGQDRYRGHAEAKIHEKDTFRRVNPKPKGQTLQARAGIEHTHGHPAKRGELWGAWAAVETANVDGSLRPPTVFFASLEEYQPDKERLEPGDPWLEFEGAMVIKAGMLWALRNGLGLTDIVGDAELHAARLAPQHAAERAQEEAAAEPDLSGDEVGQRITALFEEAQTIAPTLWLPAKLTARLSGASDAEREALADEMAESLEPTRQRQRDALERRKAELDGFDPQGLDGEDLTAYNAEVDAVSAALEHGPPYPVQTGEPAAAAA